MMRKTKIVATIGPAWDSEEAMERMLEAGVNVVRFNMKHSDLEWHSERMELLAKVCKKMKRRVATLMDLQGPEVRMSEVPEQWSVVEPGQMIRFTRPEKGGIGLDHPSVFGVLKVGQTMYADDGFLEFEVIKTNEDWVEVKVVEGGAVKPRKTVNFPGLSLDFPALVDQDLKQLSLVARHQVDWVALSFVRKASDIELLKQELQRYQVAPKVMAKIEHPEAVEGFDEILAVADGVMVARGDLGVEYALEEVPGIQKIVVAKTREAGKPVVIATQMLESMITQPRPTRAEVSDMANAVYEGVDAVMLSAESATGKYPVRAVQMMTRVLGRAEKDVVYPEHETIWEKGSQDAGMVAAAHKLMETAFDEVSNMKGYVVLTESGRTAELLSRLRPRRQIWALAGEPMVLDQLCLVWGVEPVLFPYEKKMKVRVKAVIERLLELKLVHSGDQVIMVYGETWGEPGKTSVLRVQEVV